MGNGNDVSPVVFIPFFIDRLKPFGHYDKASPDFTSMNNNNIPVIKRTPPLLLMLIVAIPFFLLAVPLNWLLEMFGRPSALMRFIGRKAGASQKFGKIFADYVPDNHDVFVCAYSKSGRFYLSGQSSRILPRPTTFAPSWITHSRPG